MDSKRSNVRREWLYPLYAQLSPPRSLRRLAEILRDAGMEISVRTLARYSKAGGWQARVRLDDARAAALPGESLVEAMRRIRDRHASIARGLQAAGSESLRRYVADEQRLGQARPAEIARLLDVGTRLERATFAPAHTVESTIAEIMSALVDYVPALFRQVNGLTDPNERAYRFITGYDSFADELFARYGLVEAPREDAP
jgi:hypothetical protein